MMERRPDNRDMALNQSLARGLAILEVFSRETPELGVRELSRILRLHKSVVHRLARTLAGCGFLEQNPETMRYRLGLRAFEVGNQYVTASGLEEAALPVLRSVAGRHPLNMYLGALRSDQVVYLVALQGNGPIVVRAAAGERVCVHSTALGKVLLGALPPARAAEILRAAPLPKLTRATLVRPSDLLAELQNVRQRGFAMSNEENLPGVVAAGAPVRDQTGQVIAAVSGACPRHLISDERIPEIVRLVVGAAERISSRLGAPALHRTPTAARSRHA